MLARMKCTYDPTDLQVHNLVWLEMRICFHLFQDCEGSLDVAILAMPFDHSAESNQIRLCVLCLHIFQNICKFVHTTAPGTCIDQGVVHNDGELDLFVSYLLIHAPGAIYFLLSCETFQQRAIYNRV